MKNTDFHWIELKLKELKEEGHYAKIVIKDPNKVSKYHKGIIGTIVLFDKSTDNFPYVKLKECPQTLKDEKGEVLLWENIPYERIENITPFLPSEWK
ncbi:MAG: hypothetical protein MUE81_11690 [Thermoflexibacter sp.]|jgi:hypothetical protein|nr:hypothetical protein [Thermoflexibacter sp.]